MSSTTHTITLTAKDGTQQVFSAIEKGAKQDAAALQEMGQKGSASLKQVETSAGAAATGAEKFNRAWAAAGIVAGTAAQLLGEWSRSSQDAAAIQRQLEAAIAATGEQYSTYADRVQAAGERAVQLGQDDEAASQAIAALTEITGSANTALNEMGLVMDLAAAKGMSLESAAELVGKVHEGNTAILQRYGIVVEKGATAEQALAQIQAQVAGQAEAHATTYARLREELSNVTDAIGGTVGGFAPFLAMLPGLSVGVTAATGAIGALIPEMEAAGVASAALDLALGPVGIVLAAGAAVVAIYELTKGHHEESAAAKEAASSTEALAKALASLNASGSPLANTATQWADALNGALGTVNDQLAKTKEQVDTITHDLESQKQAGGGGTVGDPEAIKQEQDDLFALQTQLQQLTIASHEQAKAQQALIDIYNDTGTGAELARAAAQKLFDAYDGTAEGARKLISGLVILGSNLGNFDVQANNVKATVEGLSRATDRQQAAQESWAASIKASTDAQVQSIAATSRQQQQQETLTAEMTAQAHLRDLYFQEQAFQQDQYQQGLADQITASEKAAEAQAKINATTIEIPDVNAAADALRREESALDRVARGSTSAAVAMRAFSDVQDGLIGQEQVYSQQASVYSQQVNAMSDARDILQQRQADGIALTQQEIDFLNQYDEANARATGGVEDATVAQGILAEQYALNMKKGDELNSSLDDVNKTTGSLTDAIRDLIATMTGIPPDVTSEVHVIGIEEAQAALGNVASTLNAIDGRIANVGVNVSVNDPNGIGTAIPGLYGLGGMVSAAGGRMVTVNEGGRETATLPTGDTVWLPTGSTVWPHAASVEGNRGGGGVRPFYNYGTIHIHANNPTEFWDQMNGYGLAGR